MATLAERISAHLEDRFPQLARTPNEYEGLVEPGLNVTEDTAARVFAQQFEGRMIFCHDHGKWFEFEGGIWRVKKQPVAFHYARELARRLSIVAKNGQSLQKTRFASGVETFCRADPTFSRLASQWDQHPFLLGTPDGTVNLHTGYLMAPNPQDYITKSTAVAPLNEEECPRWKAFLTQATNGDAEMVRFLQQICGYALTGDTREQALFFIYGNGGNGKGVFLNTLSHLIGSYAATATMDAFTASRRNSSGPSPDIAMLAGARLVSASETEEGVPWAEARLKALTGGDDITARFNRQDNFTFRPIFKLLIIGNYQPVLSNVDDAMRRRFNMIPFVHKPYHKDPQLEANLRNEWPGILRWMINGCLDWQSNGLVRPRSVAAATETYFDDQNTFADWLKECCDVDHSNEHLTCRSSEVFSSWEGFCKRTGEKPGSNKTFKQTMIKNAFFADRTSLGIFFKGISVKADSGISPQGRADFV